MIIHLQRDDNQCLLRTKDDKKGKAQQKKMKRYIKLPQMAPFVSAM